MNFMRVCAAILAAVSLAGCSRPASNEAPPSTNGDTSPVSSPGAGRTYLLEQVDDAAVVQLYADGFRALPLRENPTRWISRRRCSSGAE